jgi:dihydroorotate dehydrogenase electron transfer subunit
MKNKDEVEMVKRPGEFTCRVCEQLSISPDYYLLSLEAPELARNVSPGQFVMLRCGEGYDNFLRRPMSIHQVDRSRGQLDILYQVKGKGTNWLSKRTSGELLSLLGPLGHGFTCSESAGKGLLIGAGVGVAPLLFLAS